MNWTSEWPTEPGHYWFYGCRYAGRARPGRPYYVTVLERQTLGSVYYITCGDYLSKAGGAEGVWQPVQFPELPREDTNGLDTS